MNRGDWPNQHTLRTFGGSSRCRLRRRQSTYGEPGKPGSLEGGCLGNLSNILALVRMATGH